MNVEGFEKLVDRYLDGIANSEEIAGLNQLVKTEAVLADRFVEIAGVDYLIADVYEAHEASVPADLRHEVDLAGSPQSIRAGYSTRHRRFIKFAPALAVAASVALVVGLFAYFYSPRQPTRIVAGLHELIQQAEQAKTVADLKALHKRAYSVYEGELARGDDCSLPALVNLGLATAITGNPREDRQTADLRFVLAQAAQAPEQRVSALPRLSLIPSAYAAVEPLDVDQRGIREAYAKARRNAAEYYYDQWEESLEQMVKQATNRPLLSDALSFELGYVTAYERELSRMGKRLLESIPADSPYGGYYGADLKRFFTAAAKREAELEANMDFENYKVVGTGDWHVEKTPDGVVVQQSKVTKSFTSLGLDKPDFREVIVTGQAKVLQVGTLKPHVLMLGFRLDRRSSVIMSLGPDIYTNWGSRWGKFKYRLTPSGKDGSDWHEEWDAYLEGSQGSPQATATERTTSIRQAPEIHLQLKLRGVDLITVGTSVVWRDLELKVVR